MSEQPVGWVRCVNQIRMPGHSLRQTKEEWDKLSLEDKQDLIDSLPPAKR